MSILGTLIDRTQGTTLTGVTMTTLAHSLGQNPEKVDLNLRSAVSATAAGSLIAIGGNASLLTVGLQAASVSLGSNLCFFDTFAMVIHSIIR